MCEGVSQCVRVCPSVGWCVPVCEDVFQCVFSSVCVCVINPIPMGTFGGL